MASRHDLARTVKRKTLVRLAGLRRYGLRARRHAPGTAPGSLAAGADAAAAQADAPSAARLSLLLYDREALHEQADVDIGSVASLARDAAAAGQLLWLHLQGMPSGAQLAALGQALGLHPLALEDVQHRERRAKVEAYDAHQFVILNLVHRDPQEACRVDQVSLFLGRFGVVSINDGSHDVFEPVRQRIRGRGRIRQQGADYLLYALVDVVVDSGFPLLEQLGDELEALEDEILEDPDCEARNRIHLVKRELVLVRRSWWPQREVIAALMRDDEPFIQDATRVYLRDCYDHTVVIIDFVETYREMAASLLDIYLSAVSQRMNNIMKALTVVATIFLPLTFITGLYGMNFDTGSRWNMPELHWRYGYVYVLAVMSATVGGMLWFFRRRGWL